MNRKQVSSLSKYASNYADVQFKNMQGGPFSIQGQGLQPKNMSNLELNNRRVGEYQLPQSLTSMEVMQKNNLRQHASIPIETLNKPMESVRVKAQVSVASNAVSLTGRTGLTPTGRKSDKVSDPSIFNEKQTRHSDIIRINIVE